MTAPEPIKAPKERPDPRALLSDVRLRAVYLFGLCQGADVLYDGIACEPNEASNAMVPLLQVIQEKAREVVDMIEAMEAAMRPT